MEQVQHRGKLTPASMISTEHVKAMMEPRGVAIVGATDRANSVGRTICENITAQRGSFEVYYVNPKREQIFGSPCIPLVSEIEGTPDLAIIVTPASICESVLRDCGKHGGVRAVIIIAAGFAETGDEGRKRESDLVRIASENNISIIGPNCLGIQAPLHNLNASFAAAAALPGSCAFISQSGAMCTAILDWSLSVGFGYSAFVSLGSMSHMDWANLIEYYGSHESTKSIMVYMESISRAGAFMHAARHITPNKPIIVIKAGKSPAAALAAISHTGAMVGSHTNFLAAMRRAGCMVVDTIEEFQNSAIMTANQPPPLGENVIIITNAGGPGVLCTDAASAAGLNVVRLDKELIESLNEFLPAAWSHNNPVDILGDATANMYALTLKLILDKAPKRTSMIIVCSPQSVTQPLKTAQIVIDVISEHRQTRNTFEGPILCAWMGGQTMEKGCKLLNRCKIPCFSQPDITAKTLGMWVKQRKIASEMTELPQVGKVIPQTVLSIFRGAQAQNRKCLSEAESKEIFRHYGVPTVGTIIADDPNACVKAAETIGYPVVMKVNGGKFSHKSDIGGVKINIMNAAEVKSEFSQIKQNYEAHDPGNFEGVTVQRCVGTSGVECILGCVQDEQFGPMIMFGAGGTMVEILHDAAVTLAPANELESEILVNRTLIAKALEPTGQRFKGCDKTALYSIISKFSIMCTDLWPYICEVEINPLRVDSTEIMALDGRVTMRQKMYDKYSEPCMLFTSTH